MSIDIDLRLDGACVEVPPHFGGATVAVNWRTGEEIPERFASIIISDRCGRELTALGVDHQWLRNRKAGETIPALREAAKENEIAELLLGWAELHPEAIWDIWA